MGVGVCEECEYLISDLTGHVKLCDICQEKRTSKNNQLNKALTPPTTEEVIDACKGSTVRFFYESGDGEQSLVWCIYYDELNAVVSRGYGIEEALGGAANKWYWLKKDGLHVKSDD